MNHKENYAKLLNTLVMVETKGTNTIIVADCLKFLEQCINECIQEEKNQRIDEIMAMEKAESAEKMAEEEKQS